MKKAKIIAIIEENTTKVVKGKKYVLLFYIIFLSILFFKLFAKFKVSL